MPEFKRDTPEAGWTRRRNWESVRTELRALLKEGEDRGAFKVRSSADEGDEDRADRHVETMALFRDDTGRTPLHHAVAENATVDDVIRRLDAGAEADVQDEGGWTPLHAAAAGNAHPEVVTTLVEHGASVAAENEDGMMPLHVAAWESEHSAMVTALVGAGANIDARDKYGWTPLHFAARRGWPEMVEALVKVGANVNQQADEQGTPLDVAEEYDHPKVVEILSRAGANRDRAEVRAGVSDVPDDTSVQAPVRSDAERSPDTSHDPGPQAPIRSNADPGSLVPRVSRQDSPPDAFEARELPAGWYDATRRARREDSVVSTQYRRKSRGWRWVAAAVVVFAAGGYWFGNDDDARSPGAAADNLEPEAAAVVDPSEPEAVAGADNLEPAAVAVTATPELDAGTAPPVGENPDVQRVDGSTSAAEPPAPRTAERGLNLDRSARRRIQEGLQEAGFEPGPADGMFGTGTRDAIRDWQSARGVPATGYLNGAEVELLNGLLAGRRGRVEAAVEPRGGSLTVRAEPASQIALDGSDVGSTGSSGLLVLSGIRPGRHVVVARKQGYTEATNVVEVVEGRSEVVELTLDALPGTLTVTANVPGAILSIEGAGDHRLPVTRLDVSAGSRRVTVMGAGYEPVEENVEIRAGELTTLDVVLEPVRVGELVRVVRSRFDAGNYQGTVEGARAVLSIRPDAGAAHLLLGRALYQLGRFDESAVPLYRAILLGEQVVLPTNHRHGGGGFRQGLCRGVISLSTSEVAFRSREEPDHGFAITPDKISDVEIAEAVGGQAFRLNTRIQDQGTRRRSFDFVHRGTRRQRQDPDSPLFVLLTCPDCDGSMGVQAALMEALSRSGM